MGSSVRAWNALSGHPEVAWSVVLQALVDPVPSMDDLRRRLGAAPFRGHLAEAERESELDRLRDAFADLRYRDGRPLVRMARGPSGLVLAAHHSALDGLGLVALLGLALDAPVRSDVRGVPETGDAGRSLPVAVAALARAVVSPRARVAPDGGMRERGDHLLHADVAASPGGTSGLVAAVAEAITTWNAAHAGATAPMEIAVGASRRPGDRLTLADESTWMRVRVDAWSPETVRSALRASAVEFGPPVRGPAALAAWPVARATSRRSGSTALVSNLGRIEGAPGLRSLAFWPVAHGRSGVAIGAATVGERTTITLRARRSDFGPGPGARRLEEIARRLGPSDPRVSSPQPDLR